MSETGNISLKRDFMFKGVFTRIGKEAYLKEFLSSLLKLEIKKIEIEHDIHLEREYEKAKLGIIDVRAKLNNNTIVNIEMQVENKGNIIPRSVFYGSKLYSSQLKEKEEYKKLKKVIVICILDYNMFHNEDYINKKIAVLENDREHVIDDEIVYYYIELPKFRKLKKNLDDRLTQWLVFIDNTNREELETVMEKNTTVKEANETYGYLQGDEEIKRIAELREKYERDRKSAMYNYRRIGIEEGKEQGRKEGLAEGKKILNQEKVNIAKELLKEGMSVEKVSIITKLSKDEIEKLANEK